MADQEKPSNFVFRMTRALAGNGGGGGGSTGRRGEHAPARGSQKFPAAPMARGGSKGPPGSLEPAHFGGGPRELRALPAGKLMHPSRIHEPLWDAIDPAPLPSWDCTGPWMPREAETRRSPQARHNYALLPDRAFVLSEGEADEEEGGSAKDWRSRGELVLSSMLFQFLMAALIIANAIVIGLETDNSDLQCWDVVEDLFLFLFAGELLLKLFVQHPYTYFAWSGADFTWNVFDFFIVSLGTLDFFMGMIFGASSGGGIATVFRIIRLLRILRIFRIVKFLKQLYMLAFGFALAAVAVFWVTILMVFVLYVCSIILVRTVGHAPAEDPQADFLHRKFGNIMRAMLTLFEIMSSPTLEDYEDVMWERPSMALFIIVFIIFGSFGMIALLTGVISESMFDKNNLRMEEERIERENMRKMLIRTCERLFDELPSQCGDHPRQEGAFTWEVKGLLPQIASLFESEGVDYAGEDLYGMLDIIDPLDANAIQKDEFKFFIVQIAEGVRPLLIMRLYYQVTALRMETLDIHRNVQGLMHSTRDAHDLQAKASQKEDTQQVILQRLDQIASNVEGLGSRMDRLGSRMDEISNRVDQVSTRVTESPSTDSGLKAATAQGSEASSPTNAKAAARGWGFR